MSLDRVVQPLVACLGNPVGGNPTQFVMTRLVREAELDWRFFTSEVPPELFETAFLGIQALGMSGAAILPPFQSSMESYLGSISPKAKALGVVQVAKWESNQWVGDETLTNAMLRSLTHRISSLVEQHSTDAQDTFSPQSIGVLGSAGLVQALDLSRADIPGDYSVFPFDLANRKNNHTQNQSQPETPTAEPSGVAQAHEQGPEELDDSSDRPIKALIIEGFDAIMGLSSHARGRLLKEANWAHSPLAIFAPPPTGWIEATKERSQCIEELQSRGLSIIDELDVLTHQFALNFEFWTGYEAPLDSIRESLEEYLQW
jgi:shikimate dehydrogenase